MVKIRRTLPTALSEDNGNSVWPVIVKLYMPLGVAGNIGSGMPLSSRRVVVPVLSQTTLAVVELPAKVSGRTWKTVISGMFWPIRIVVACVVPFGLTAFNV